MMESKIFWCAPWGRDTLKHVYLFLHPSYWTMNGLQRVELPPERMGAIMAYWSASDGVVHELGECADVWGVELATGALPRVVACHQRPGEGTGSR